MQTADRRKKCARWVKELYLYPPSYSVNEVTIKMGVWAASWVVGIFVPTTVDIKALGGAYFILTLSMLVEFLP